jgi:hypothetical protein
VLLVLGSLWSILGRSQPYLEAEAFYHSGQRPSPGVMPVTPWGLRPLCLSNIPLGSPINCGEGGAAVTFVFKRVN